MPVGGEAGVGMNQRTQDGDPLLASTGQRGSAVPVREAAYIHARNVLAFEGAVEWQNMPRSEAGRNVRSVRSETLTAKCNNKRSKLKCITDFPLTLGVRGEFGAVYYLGGLFSMSHLMTGKKNPVVLLALSNCQQI